MQPWFDPNKTKQLFQGRPHLRPLLANDNLDFKETVDSSSSLPLSSLFRTTMDSGIDALGPIIQIDINLILYK